MKNNLFIWWTRRCPGFTLIEVLIALAIVSIAFTAILLSSTQTLRNTQYLQNKVIANWVATNVINDIRAHMLTPTTEPLSADMDMLGKKWLWQAALQPSANPHIQKITVDVSQSPERKKLLSLVSYIYV
jgi:general secretion pathway protein I